MKLSDGTVININKVESVDPEHYNEEVTITMSSGRTILATKNEAGEIRTLLCHMRDIWVSMPVRVDPTE